MRIRIRGTGAKLVRGAPLGICILVQSMTVWVEDGLCGGVLGMQSSAKLIRLRGSQINSLVEAAA